MVRFHIQYRITGANFKIVYKMSLGGNKGSRSGRTSAPFITPAPIRFGPVDAPVNTLGFRRVMLVVDNIDEVVARLRAYDAEISGDMQYEDTYRLAYIRGPEGIIVGLSEQLGSR